MKLGETKEFWVLRKGRTEGFYMDVGTSTVENVLEAQRFTKREEVEEFKTKVAQWHIRIEQTVPFMELLHIQITAMQLPL